jgi:hypothetical protein
VKDKDAEYKAVTVIKQTQGQTNKQARMELPR